MPINTYYEDLDLEDLLFTLGVHKTRSTSSGLLLTLKRKVSVPIGR